MSWTIKGLGVSEGIGFGQLLIVKPQPVVEKIKVQTVETEILALDRALEEAIGQLKAIYDQKVAELGQDKAMIFNAHIMLLQDPVWIEDMKNMIKSELCNTAFAVQSVANQTAQMFEAMDNDYFKERAHDIIDVSRRLIRCILQIADVDLSTIPQGTIIVSEDLTPSDTAQLNRHNVVGIVTAIGGKTSHSAIIARTLGIPAVMGIGKATFEKCVQGQKAIIDGFKGDVIIEATDQETAHYQNQFEHIMNERNALNAFVGKTSTSADGKTIEIACNIASPNDIEAVNQNDADGIGLFRSEFLFMDRKSAPSEEDQYLAYKEVLEGMGQRPVIIRTMDIGGDKEVPYLGMEKEMNPFLGYRAVRYCLDQTDLFRVQLRALLRASVFGNLKIMVPMISSVQEIRSVKVILEEEKAKLKTQGITFDEAVKLGIMIEIPSAAIASDLLAKEVDFFSIGTNDLIQYTVAVDRMNEKIADLYTPYHPAVLRLIKMTIDNAHRAGIWVGMCGSVAGDMTLMPLLLGMGLDEFSMSPSKVLKARQVASTIDTQLMANQVDEILSLSTSEEIEAYLKEMTK